MPVCGISYDPVPPAFSSASYARVGFSVLETAIQTRGNQAKENQKTALWFLYSFVVERSGRFTQLQMGKKDKSLRKGGDILAYLFESLTFVSLQMENTEAKRLI